MRTPTKATAWALATYASNGTGIAFPSIAELADSAGLSRSGVNMAIAQLRENGFLKTQARGSKEGGRTTNLYQLMIPDNLPGSAQEVEDRKERIPF